MVTDGRTLRALDRAGWINWTPGTDRHWTGHTVKRVWVEEGPKLQHRGNWWAPFEHNGKHYELHYVDGCFKPFVFRAGSRVPDFV